MVHDRPLFFQKIDNDLDRYRDASEKVVYNEEIVSFSITQGVY